jgi:cytochrome c oxidase cbb3-type subunit 3
MDSEQNKNIENSEIVNQTIADHDYDGIKELDNPPPPWIMNLFYITIAFSIAYAAYYHWFKQGDLQATEYEKDVAAANAKNQSQQQIEKKPLVLLTDESSIKAGGDIFTKNCSSCHGTKGEGLIGPNLCDNSWITGNSFESITHTIKNGTPNGMTAFQALPDDQLAQVASFILKKLQGTTPPNAKAPQGTQM